MDIHIRDLQSRDLHEVRRNVISHDGKLYVEHQEGDRHDTRERIEAFKTKIERDRRRAEGGTFTFTNMEPMKRLAAEVDATQLGYLFVLQTFIDYDTNVLVIGRDRRPMTKEDIQKALNVNRHTLRAFMVEMERYSVIMEGADGRYVINDEYIFRGALGKNPRVVKTFDQLARNLYDVTQSSRKVKQLGYLVKALPYLSVKNNAICANPFEIDPELIRPLDKAELAELFGVTEKSVYTLIRTMQIGDEVVFREMIEGSHRVYLVNPYVCARTDFDEGFKSLFKIGRQHWYRKNAAKQAAKKAKENE